MMLRHSWGRCLVVRVAVGALKMRDWKMGDWNYRHQTAGVENAGQELSGTGNVWNAACDPVTPCQVP